MPTRSRHNFLGLRRAGPSQDIFVDMDMEGRRARSDTSDSNNRHG